MPNYDYSCENCEVSWEEFNAIEERHTSKCKQCGKEGKLLVTLHRQPIVFQSQYFEHIGPDPVYAGNKKQLKEHLKRHNCSMPYAFD